MIIANPMPAAVSVFSAIIRMASSIQGITMGQST